MLRADSPRDSLTLATLVNERRFDELLQGFRAGGDPLSALKLIRSAENEGQRNWMARNPEHPRSKLDRYILVHYETLEAAQAAAESLQREPTVQFAFASGGDESGSEPGGGGTGRDPPTEGEGTPNRWHLDAVNASAAWVLQTGWIPVGVMDSGLDTNHPKFLPFIGNTYNGGNWVRGLSRDIVNSSSDPRTVDEHEVEDNCVTTPLVGHGTHVAGLVAASDVGNQNAVGVCHNCSLIVTKRSRCVGVSSSNPALPTAESLFAASITHQVDWGASVVNYSAALCPVNGVRRYMSAGCAWAPQEPECLALDYAYRRDVAVVAASGNFPTSSMGFPGSNVYTIAVSGVEQDGGAIRNWLRVGPNRTDGRCPAMAAAGDPVFTSMELCGGSARWGGVFATIPNIFTGNYWPHDRAPEVVAPAFQVYSTFYTGGTWVGEWIDPGPPNPDPRPFWRTCMDENENPTPTNDGFGFCTGTSMAAPIVTGVVGLVRSSNPYLKVGERDQLVPNGLGYAFGNGYQFSVSRVAPTGIRSVLAQASSIPGPVVKPAPHVHPTMPLTDEDIVGSGLPDARVAVELTLGRVGGVPLLNRVVPAYHMSSAYTNDTVAITVPQQFWALLFSGYGSGYGWSVGQAPAFTGELPSFNQYQTEFFGYGGAFYVFTTPSLLPGLEGTMVPIFLIDRTATPGVEELSWAVGVQDLTFFVTNGWEYLGRQGYLYREKSFGSPTCNHSSLVMVYRLCSTTECAIVISQDVQGWIANGYTESNTALGCAIKNVHSDPDWIPDGFESLVGLKPLSLDTDGDGCTDRDEYSTFDVQKSDPNIAGDCP